MRKVKLVIKYFVKRRDKENKIKIKKFFFVWKTKE